MIRLYTSSELATTLGITKQGLHKAVKEGRIEEAEYLTGKNKGWTKEQVERIRRVYIAEK